MKNKDKDINILIKRNLILQVHYHIDKSELFSWTITNVPDEERVIVATAEKKNWIKWAVNYQCYFRRKMKRTYCRKIDWINWTTCCFYSSRRKKE